MTSHRAARTTSSAATSLPSLHRTGALLVGLSGLLTLPVAACKGEQPQITESGQVAETRTADPGRAAEIQRLDPTEPFAAYPWLDEASPARPELSRLDRQIPTPSGLTRQPHEPGSFGDWLTGLPVRLDRDRVMTHDGRPTGSASPAVIALDLGQGDLQQCADCVLRLRAEYLWAIGAAEQAAFHFTSGHLSTWAAWRAGERVSVQGSRVRTSLGSAREDDHSSFRAWLQQLFVYAGSLSLGRDARRVGADEPIQAGDTFVEPGSPGHVVIVLDVAVDRQGDRYGLIGQGFTPAQDFHVIAGAEAIDGVWFKLPETPDELLDVPTWRPFARSSALRFEPAPAP